MSGNISARNEKPCSYYPHSRYRKAVQWMLDLKNIKYDDNRLNQFDASMTPISSIRAFSVILNPFAEAYPESGNAEGMGFKTIASYIRDGGIVFAITISKTCFLSSRECSNTFFLSSRVAKRESVITGPSAGFNVKS
jgi:hypothetical protein